MTRGDVLAAIRDIEANVHDPERAHGQEDELYKRVLRAIARREDGDSPAVLASEALVAAVIDYDRWYS